MVVRRPKIDFSESRFRPGVRPGLGELEPGKKSFRRKSRFPSIFSGAEVGPKPGFGRFGPKSGWVHGRSRSLLPGMGLWAGWGTSQVPGGPRPRRWRSWRRFVASKLKRRCGKLNMVLFASCSPSASFAVVCPHIDFNLRFWHWCALTVQRVPPSPIGPTVGAAGAPIWTLPGVAGRPSPGAILEPTGGHDVGMTR